MKTLNERIRELREGLDLSLRELARRLGVSAAFLSDVELGRRHPSDELLAKLAHELRISTEDLRSYDTRPPVADLRRLTVENPAYGLAFRRVIDQDVSPDELMKLARQKGRKRKK